MENGELDIGVDVDKDGKPDFILKLKGNKRIILFGIIMYALGALTEHGLVYSGLI